MLILFILILIIIILYTITGSAEDMLKIFQWNILALPYFNHTSYNSYKKNIFNIKNRNKLIYNKIKQLAQLEYVICLQEIDEYTWLMIQPILVNYTALWAPYGVMGILVAVPAKYKVIDKVEILIDRRWLIMCKTDKFVIASYHAPLIKIPYTTDIDEIKQNENIKKTTTEFMNYAGSMLAYFAGDFNMIPTCLAYGALPPALINLHKKNPRFTVNARATIVGYIDKFCDTLDYIFGLNLTDKQLKNYTIFTGDLRGMAPAAGNLYPALWHPSDHLFIDLKIAI